MGHAAVAADGTFGIENLMPGRYRVQAFDAGAIQRTVEDLGLDDKPGKVDVGGLIAGMAKSMVLKDCVVKDGETTSIELDASELELPGTLLEATVVVGDEPLAEGLAEVSRPEQGAVALAMIKDGRFEVSGQRPGKLRVQIRQGLTMAPLGEAVEIDIPPDRETHRERIQLPGGCVAGVVVDDATSEPLAGTPVRLSPSDRPEARQSLDWGLALTDSAGRFRFRGVREGVYSVVADDQLALRPGSSGGRIEGIRVEAGAAVEGLQLRARPSAGVTAMVTGPDGMPVPRAAVVAVDAAGNPLSSMTVAFTGSDGRAFLGGLAAGAVRVVARAPNLAPACSPLSHVSPAQETELQVQLTTGTQVEVAVQDESGQPVSGAAVAVRLGDGPWLPATMLQAQSSVEGRVDLGPLPAGTIRLRVSHTGRPPLETERTVPAGRRATLTVSLPR
jgi:hypothetical protein